MEKTNLDFLVKKGIISQEQLDSAKAETKRTGIPLEKALEKLGFISEVDIAQAMADSIGVPFMDLTDYLIDTEVVKLVPETLAKKHKAVPLFKIGDTLTIAMADPRDIPALDEIRAKSKAGAVDAVLSTPDMIQKVIDQYYSAQGSIAELAKSLTKEKLEEKTKETPVIKLVSLIIIQAVKERASDIHIEPEEDKVRIRYRIDGILHEVQEIPKHLQNVLASRVKVMAKMDIAETRNAQDGRIQLKMENKDLDLRVSSFPTIHGENIVLRILDKTSVLLGLKDLGFLDRDLKEFNKIIVRPNGIILVTGPTGSGKTTTLYAALSTINSLERNIITIEDPVEYEISLIRQTQVNPKAGLTFAKGLRSILRASPDIVMVGEIRDSETAQIAIEAALTGHLVLSTLHTNDAPGAISRLVEMGVEPFLVASAITCVQAQRLARRLCKECKEEYSPDKKLLQDIGFPIPKNGKVPKIYKSKGCSQCGNTGYKGRLGLYEIMLMNEEIERLTVEGATADQIKEVALFGGMTTLKQDGFEKVLLGLTSIEEILRVAA